LYLHKVYSPLVLPRAVRPSPLKGYIGTLPRGYIRNVPLPRVPIHQSTLSHQVHTITEFQRLMLLVHSRPHGTLLPLILGTTFCLIFNGNHLATKLLSTSR
jgi:hypothetical protein